MDKLHFSVLIDAPKEKVWDKMLEEKTYREWTETFGPGSHYKGDWNKGSRMMFLAPDPSGKMGGMVSRIAENRKYEYISIEHLGIIQNDIEDTSSEEAKKWAGIHENYTMKEKNGRTELLVDIEINEEEFKNMFRDMWPRALQKLKEMSEKQ
ncbi:MAG TPA: SRPBCC domain-containing protein [Ignavibacteriaceae bacterium]|nr:SRPBCC domain-containing protein [Ignavibacteriaceae bacterium]